MCAPHYIPSLVPTTYPLPLKYNMCHHSHLLSMTRVIIPRNEHVAQHGIDQTHIALDNLEIINNSGIQVGGESPKPVASIGSLECEARPGYIVAIQERATLNERLAKADKVRASMAGVQEEFEQLNQEFMSAQDALNQLAAGAEQQNEAAEAVINELSEQVDAMQQVQNATGGVAEDPIEEAPTPRGSAQPRSKRRKVKH